MGVPLGQNSILRGNPAEDGQNVLAAKGIAHADFQYAGGLAICIRQVGNRTLNLDSAVEPVARPTKVRKMCEKSEKLLRHRTHPYGER